MSNGDGLTYTNIPPEQRNKMPEKAPVCPPPPVNPILQLRREEISLPKEGRNIVDHFQTESRRDKQKSMYPKAKFFKYKDKWRVTVKGQSAAVDMSPGLLEQYFGVCGGPLVYVIRQLGESTLRVELKNGFITRASICPGNVETLMSGGTEVTEFTLDYVAY